MEWDAAISWQLRGLRGSLRDLLECCGLHVATFKETSRTTPQQPRRLHHCHVRRTRNYHDVATDYSISRNFPFVVLTGHLYGKWDCGIIIHRSKWSMHVTSVCVVGFVFVFLKTLFNIVEAPLKQIVKLSCLCCMIMFRWTNKQPGIQKFFNLCSHYQDIYDWISPLNKRQAHHPSNTAVYAGRIE